MKIHIEHQDGTIQVLNFRQHSVRLGRSSDCEVRFDDARYTKVSSLHAELIFESDGWRVLHHSRSNKTLVNDQPIDASKAIHPGDIIRLGFTGPAIHIVNLDSNDSTSPATLMADQVPRVLQSSGTTASFDVRKGGTIGRDKDAVDFWLDHPHVSRQHARVIPIDRNLVLEDSGSANGTFLNGERMVKPMALADGDIIDLGPFAIEYRSGRLVSRSRENNVQLVADRVTFEVQSRTDSKPIKLLSNVEFVLNPGEFLCILGPSGSGKSTLLSTLSGRSAPSGGAAYINGRNLHANFGALKSDICVLPQSLALHDSLTVEQTLLFTSAIRLQPDLSRRELQDTVDAMIQTVGLNERRNVRIRQLSGGQLKRVGLAAELVSDPSLLFLDEVTSGLDEQADREMMKLFRGLSEGGKTVVCVTHNLGHIMDHCGYVVVLTVGGKLAFFGTPHEAIRYFKIERLSDIYDAINSKQPDDWSSRFRVSVHNRKYVIDRKPALQKEIAKSVHQFTLAKTTLATWTRQFTTILQRTIAVWRGDPTSIATLVGQPLLVGILLCLVFGQYSDLVDNPPLERIGTTRNLLFLLCVSCYWLGCNSSVKELVHEREIFVRERNFNLIPEAYLAAKLCFFAFIAVMQSLLLAIITFAWYDPPGNGLAMLGTLCVLSLSGSVLGQAISATAKSEETAVAIVPIVVIPQIILGGVVATLSGLAAWIARVIITVYWGDKLVERFLPDSEQFPTDFTPSTATCISIISIHSLILLGIAWVGIRQTRPAN